MNRLEGKVALITGAARGMGRSHAIRLAEEGAAIVALDICRDIDNASTGLASQADLAETALLVEKAGGSVVALEADVRDLEALQRAASTAVDHFGTLDIVCANAAIASFGPSWELSEDAWRDVMDVNLTGSWHTAKACLPAMIELGRGGSIVFVNSVNGLKSGPGISHYAASKHGVVGLMKSLASEAGRFGIRVNSVHPTMVGTAMTMNEAAFRRYLPEVDEPTLADMQRLMEGRHALDVPMIEAVDVSNAVLWLASDEARYVTGVTLPVDAGMLVR
ncbi:mycofactocin-coupled SDR family oxidoreductase [Nocardioides bizhenqiangii]|uniref:Mycofactocin-coupled SDR family oxidoreductase n=1 Tax=Nocardioides bizhenqiangii TaxID=3095076 RepID=A0ABZ0ZN57_9ACTN|nr:MULTISPECIES: mycofactocin-coupled SDR family oxidoreductase [unclassified Nocardioides]MDZ5621030.1 mycofactocin-coupled SDR family oxidoreductase [Nocardioides sp. HM23]WQQ25386.1 mycofactocin-coupled SDR family oxidoreductase [Nocardioides sp. HM61]